MKKQIERIKSQIRIYINNCEESEYGKLYRENWWGLTSLINGFAHNINDKNSKGGHDRRQNIKKRLIDYSINFMRDEKENYQRRNN